MPLISLASSFLYLCALLVLHFTWPELRYYNLGLH